MNRTHKRSRKGDTFFVFEFDSEEEFEAYIDDIKRTAMNADSYTERQMLYVADTLHARCGDKYAEKCACSAALFPSEVAKVLSCFVELATQCLAVKEE